MTVKTDHELGQFCWVDLVAHDMAAARRFYEALFGWKSVVQDTQGGPPYAFFQWDGKDVAGVGQMSDEMKAQGIPPLWNSYVNVADIEATTKQAVELGATITVPPMKAFEAGWLAFLQDPTGGNLGLWQKNQYAGVAVIDEPGSICWNELSTRDSARARDFYHRLFGWEYADNPHAPSVYHFIKNKGAHIGGIMQMTAEWGDMPPAWMVYFRVEDADAAAEKAKQLGGNILVPAFDIPVGRMSVVADAQGGCFTVIRLTQPPA